MNLKFSIDFEFGFKTLGRVISFTKESLDFYLSLRRGARGSLPFKSRSKPVQMSTKTVIVKIRKIVMFADTFRFFKQTEVSIDKKW